jgi:hypothetical protein
MNPGRLPLTNFQFSISTTPRPTSQTSPRPGRFLLLVEHLESQGVPCRGMYPGKFFASGEWQMRMAAESARS